ncbi:hypothetical protein DERF_010612 [Dermatophagoides farinae]|uniref:Uncharacterized protein n=1 Tax=Dermatophagoides farinae TaxID=6954 RepID=A0A922KYB3_DERFA|nr:hypothetical protein DERF_010612 [Dermatophagoides farinae]
MNGIPLKTRIISDSNHRIYLFTNLISYPKLDPEACQFTNNFIRIRSFNFKNQQQQQQTDKLTKLILAVCTSSSSSSSSKFINLKVTI